MSHGEVDDDGGEHHDGARVVQRDAEPPAAALEDEAGHRVLVDLVAELGSDSIKKNMLEFWLEKWFEIKFLFCYMCNLVFFGIFPVQGISSRNSNNFVH